jgi:hypothetical protein
MDRTLTPGVHFTEGRHPWMRLSRWTCNWPGDSKSGILWPSFRQGRKAIFFSELSWMIISWTLYDIDISDYVEGNLIAYSSVILSSIYVDLAIDFGNQSDTVSISPKYMWLTDLLSRSSYIQLSSLRLGLRAHLVWVQQRVFHLSLRRRPLRRRSPRSVAIRSATEMAVNYHPS